MIAESHIETIKQVGANGQVSLGKKYAGKQIQVLTLIDGTIIIKPGKFIPDNEMWLYNKNNNEIIDRAIKWAETNKRHENFDEIVDLVQND
ncbi:hypothetical protein BA173_06670 [Rickettsia sp. MEAM1 (Bemisia tabaci)]|uniref:Uncharacterized protein n=3 Tax=Rickettsia bellii TaxID=33990 RepID=Q1RJ01_RICBR|nr:MULTISPECIES: hypothetical protein [Rickettsia]MCC8378052.1 hypothetical protein [Rickettsia endosymbiont of Graphium doson]ABE04663.1 unknown [Rickettsia bellii RML369-C]ABV79027.1 hypothetical protein A1I_03330 [Rickettsia bellii OSU 85-389]ARD86828.1 hypothetical protein A3306_06830 [Rickettsia bellii]ASX28445.1 hypothetical protein BA173_06670 [Rickettsia sp. MEAM1 (Bemisia tabaci)]